MASIKPYEPKIDASISNMLNALKEVDQQNGVELENWMQYGVLAECSMVTNK